MDTNHLKEINDRLSKVADLRKKKLITSIVSKDNWYLNVSFDTFISILLDLNYSKEEAISIYKNLWSGK